MAAKKYWPSFTSTHLPPLLYFTDSLTIVAFAKSNPFGEQISVTACSKELKLFVLHRIDSIPFHMENEMSFTDSSSPLFFRPMMYCSDVETLIKKVPDFSSTEEWFQLVMHEYFHSFQFSHKIMLLYFQAQIPIKEDSLTKLYKQNEWFSHMLKEENGSLLQAINTSNDDSLNFYLQQFIEQRANRRKQFYSIYHYDLSAAEDFWEKMEGSARYVEYYTGLAFKNPPAEINEDCDELFHHFSGFRNRALEKEKNFAIRSQIMPAYFYVTGFNLCRLLDKLKVSYKSNLFKKPEQSLSGLLQKKVKDTRL